MAARLYRMILPVSDIDEAAAFYGAIFGVAGERVSGHRHYFDCGGVILACVDPRGDNRDAEFRPNPDHVYFAVADLEAVFERARAGRLFLARSGDLGTAIGRAMLLRPRPVRQPDLLRRREHALYGRAVRAVAGQLHA